MKVVDETQLYRKRNELARNTEKKTDPFLSKQTQVLKTMTYNNRKPENSRKSSDLKFKTSF